MITGELWVKGMIKLGLKQKVHSNLDRDFTTFWVEEFNMHDNQCNLVLEIVEPVDGTTLKTDLIHHNHVRREPFFGRVFVYNGIHPTDMGLNKTYEFKIKMTGCVEFEGVRKTYLSQAYTLVVGCEVGTTANYDNLIL